MSKYFYIPIILIVVVIKLLIIPITSFPFDFASYVYQVKQTFDFGIHPLFYWNKGFFLQGLFFLDYYFYNVLKNLLNFHENIELLHVLFKLPLLIFDILTGVYLYKIINIITNNKDKALFGLMLWFTNPMIFWSTNIEGKYAIVASFLVVFSVYLYFKKYFKLSLISLALSASIYYYAIILFPIWWIFYLQQNKYKLFSLRSFTYILIFILFILISFANFLIAPQYILPLFDSLLHHAKPDSPIDLNEIYIPNYSLFNAPFYLFRGYLPTNLTAPNYFNMTSKVTFIGLIIMLFLNVHIVIKFIKNKTAYSYGTFINYISIFLLAFILFIGKFQAHYLVWIIPFIVLNIVLYENKKIYIPYIILSTLPIFIVLGYLNLGIFFLDSIKWGVVNLWFNSTKIDIAFLGAIIILLLLYIFFIILISINKNAQRKIINEKILKSIVIVGLFVIILFVIPIQKAYISIIHSGRNTILATDNGVLRFAFIKTQKTPKTYVGNKKKVIFDYKNPYKEIVLSYNTDPKTRSVKMIDIWKPYVYKFGTTENINGVLKLNVYKKEDIAQYNMGSNYSQTLLPIDYNSEYTINVTFDSNNLNHAKYKTSIRFANENRKIIGGSDLVFEDTINENGINIDTLTFKPMDKKYKYAELFFSLKATDDFGGTVDINKVEIEQKKISPFIKYEFIGKSNKELVQKEILDNKNIRKKFDVYVSFKDLQTDDIEEILLNTCKPYNSYNKKFSVEYVFDINCAKYNQNNELIVKYRFIPENPKINMYLLHK